MAYIIRSGNGTLLHDGGGYFYTIHHNRPGSLFYSLRCNQHRRPGVKCLGRAYMSKVGGPIVLTRNHTGHQPDVLLPLEKGLRGNILNRVATGDATPFAIIVRDEGRNGGFPVEVRARLPPCRLRTAMSNVRKHHLPGIPRNLPVLGAYLAMPQYRRITDTFDHQSNLFAGVCGVYAAGTVSVVFASERQLNLLRTMVKIFADGTFRKRPRKPVASQLFTISCTWPQQGTNTKHTIVLVRVLMQKRSEVAYVALLEFLKRLVPQWDPEEIHCDHERAQVNAWRTVFPLARVASCLWHYDVDVFLYARRLGLYNTMQANVVFDKIVRSLCAIPLLPRHQLMEGLVQVGNWARATGFMHFPAVRALFVYLHREWMSRQDTLSVFGCVDRTNNVSESVNAALCWHVRKDRPNVYELINAFVLQEDQFMVDVHALERGLDAGRAQRVSCLLNDRRIQNLTGNLTNNRITILQFLLAVSHTQQAAYDHVFP
ncbi:Nonribosomal peptide synthetase imqB [Frankliniella fusca]|uniref:Nonribosomal peptide synthetase imqB n=1 Tax=Frankliniella fusca TaxID=407009 RepID=A0AAE1H0H0_9NEOP|nr:Nonribosomal peptide synthetase imqB [Frankliniella fusca]